VLRPYGVIEMVRTGRVAMARGALPLPKRRAPRLAADVDSRADVSNCSV
jgi:Small subunit of acetolactate synthase